MKILFLLLITFSLFEVGCCIRPSRTEPTYPKNVELGWVQKDGRNYGRFVLKKGEHVEINKLRIEVIEIVDDNCIGQRESSPRFATFKFINLSDGQTICKDIVVETQSSMIICNEVKELGFNYIGVYAINFTDGWVDFEIKE